MGIPCITYTNQRGVEYYLCEGRTKTGKPRYYFAKTRRETPVERIPEGYRIEESVNGVVSLVRDRPSPFRPLEVQAVVSSLARLENPLRYRIQVKRAHIEVYEREGMSATDPALAELHRPFAMDPERLRRALIERGRFAPVLRFSVHDAERRLFVAERMTYRGAGGWCHVERPAPLTDLIRRVIPTLGTDGFFELM